MQPAPIQLKQLTVERFLVESVADHDPESLRPNIDLDSEITQLASSEEQPNLWKIGLSIRVRAADESDPPRYLVEVFLSGIFSFEGNEEMDPADIATLVGVNGASILYSAAREHVYLITSRGKWGGFQLPTVSFADLSVSRGNRS